MYNENLISEFVLLWHRLEKANLDIEVIFEDGVSHQISEGVEIIWNHDNKSTCWNPD